MAEYLVIFWDIFVLLLHKNISCEYSFGKALLMSTHNLCFYGDVKIILELSSNIPL